MLKRLKKVESAEIIKKKPFEGQDFKEKKLPKPFL